MSAALIDGATWRGELQTLAEALEKAMGECPAPRCGEVCTGWSGDADAAGYQLLCPDCTKKMDALLALVRRGP